MSVESVILLLFAVAAAATGQVLLKNGMRTASTRAAASHGSLAVAAATSPWVLIGLGVLGISAVAWLAVLSRVPLSVAYPFNALGYLGILTASIVVLQERANVWTWAGTMLVVSGLIVVCWPAVAPACQPSPVRFPGPVPARAPAGLARIWYPRSGRTTAAVAARASGAAAAAAARV